MRRRMAQAPCKRSSANARAPKIEAVAADSAIWGQRGSSKKKEKHSSAAAAAAAWGRIAATDNDPPLPSAIARNAIDSTIWTWKTTNTWWTGARDAPLPPSTTTWTTSLHCHHHHHHHHHRLCHLLLLLAGTIWPQSWMMGRTAQTSTCAHSAAGSVGTTTKTTWRMTPNSMATENPSPPSPNACAPAAAAEAEAEAAGAPEAKAPNVQPIAAAATTTNRGIPLFHAPHHRSAHCFWLHPLRPRLPEHEVREQDRR